jgi:hypothetical protein
MFIVFMVNRQFSQMTFIAHNLATDPGLFAYFIWGTAGVAGAATTSLFSSGAA